MDTLERKSRLHRGLAGTAVSAALLAACAGDATFGAAPAAESTPGVQPAAVTADSCVARPAASVPGLLSQLGCFDGQDARWPGPSTIAFDVNAPLWADGAQKERFMAVPSGARIELDDQGDFVMPAGTVIVKTFTVGGRRVETRVLMNDAVEGWHGVSYRWNDGGTDADLVPAAGEELAAVGEHAQPWTIPGRGQCSTCHTAATHFAIGLEVGQLERDFTDPHGGERGNQLDRLIARGLLDGTHPTLADHAARPKLADYHDTSAPLDARARAYLHANCSSCHSDPTGFCTGDLRASTPPAAMGVLDVVPKVLDASFGWPDGTHLLTPGDPERSAILQRMRAPGGSSLAMPPIARHSVDAEGVALITEWIARM